MNQIWARSALTAEGWRSGVLLEWDTSGRITALTSDQPPIGVHQVEVLLPALSNLHSHAFQRAMAGLTERRGARAHDSFWTWRQWMYRFVESIQPEDVQAIAAMVQMEMLEAGYSGVAEFHYLHHAAGGQRYGKVAEMSEQVIAAAETTGIGLTLLPVLYQRGGCDDRALNESQQRFGNTLDSYLELQQQASHAMNTLADDSHCAVALHSLRAVDLASLQHIDSHFKEIPVHIHIAEQTAEVEEVQQVMGARPVQWLLDNCQVDERWCLVHATHMDSAETTGVAQRDAVVGLCPITEANLGDGIFNGVQYRESGGRFGVGSDSNVRIALAEELRLYEYSQRLQQRSRTVLAPESGSNGRYLYESAAQGGAQALGRDSGQLAVGNWADMVSLDTGANAMIERREDDLLDSWLFAGDDNLVQDVWSAGRHVVQDGHHTRREEIQQGFAAAMKRLVQQ